MKKWIALICLLALCLTLCACRPKYTKLTVYLDKGLPETEQRAFGTKLAAIDGIVEYTYISSEQALENFISHYEDPAAFSGVESDDLRGRYEVTIVTRKGQSVMDQIFVYAAVEEIKIHKDPIETITDALLSRAVFICFF